MSAFKLFYNLDFSWERLTDLVDGAIYLECELGVHHNVRGNRRLNIVVIKKIENS